MFQQWTLESVFIENGAQTSRTSKTTSGEGTSLFWTELWGGEGGGAVKVDGGGGDGGEGGEGDVIGDNG